MVIKLLLTFAFYSIECGMDLIIFSLHNSCSIIEQLIDPVWWMRADIISELSSISEFFTDLQKFKLHTV